ncbi:MAG TPA: tyrosine-protein phosphatase [Acidimicrobiia bacterium]|nr:tyrosine-protein phosphatase [Acidimicrobiia bacterium]
MSLPIRVPLDGPVNFRDVGGYPGADGRTVRSGRVFRSDSLSTMSDADVRHVVDELGLRTVVDLRAGHEVDQFPHGSLASTGVKFLHLPILDETRRDRTEREPGSPDPETFSTDRLYSLMLERFADRIAGVLGVVADGATHPVVFHCAAGKDRTGIVAALVLAILGVDDDTIANDYSRSADVMALMVERHRVAADERGGVAEVAHQKYPVEASVMLAMLAGLRAAHGTIAGYAVDAGLEPGAIDRLRAEMLV